MLRRCARTNEGFRQLLLLSWPVSHNTISLKDRTGTGESDRLLERTNTRMIHAAPLRPNKRRISTVITSELARQPQHNLPQRSDRHWRIRPLVGTNQHEDDPCCAAAPEQTKEGKTPVFRRTNSEHATIGSICL